GPRFALRTRRLQCTVACSRLSEPFPTPQLRFEEILMSKSWHPKTTKRVKHHLRHRSKRGSLILEPLEERLVLSSTSKALVAVNLTHSGSKVPGETLTYTLSVKNNGRADLRDVRIVDSLPKALGSVVWTATATDGSRVAASGIGNIKTDVTLKS